MSLFSTSEHLCFLYTHSSFLCISVSHFLPSIPCNVGSHSRPSHFNLSTWWPFSKGGFYMSLDTVQLINTWKAIWVLNIIMMKFILSNKTRKFIFLINTNIHAAPCSMLVELHCSKLSISFGIQQAINCVLQRLIWPGKLPCPISQSVCKTYWNGSISLCSAFLCLFK